MRIAIDIDSTLHHYWDVLSEVSRRRFGVELPYEEQFSWGITRLRPEQLTVCIAESHADAQIHAGDPYPDAVDTVRRWHAAGHYIHITSHRDPACALATERWLTAIGLPYHDLHCSQDKVARCLEIDIDVLVDDCPENLQRALAADLVVATIAHPWNRDVCEEEAVICAQDWAELGRRLDAVLSSDGAVVASRR